LARESCAKYANWLMAASLAAVNWSILNMVGFLWEVGRWGYLFAALHNDHSKHSAPGVKDYLVQRSKEMPGVRVRGARSLQSNTYKTKARVSGPLLP
jgi:hypothetical protein